MPFVDRVEAGRRLAELLEPLRDAGIVVLGLPRGGVPVAFEVARALRAPLDVIVVRKLGVPFQPELAMGAVGEEGIEVVNDQIVRLAGISADAFAAVEQRERAEVAKRASRFRGGRPRVPLAGRTAVIVDDGVATGATARAACQVARAEGAAQVVLAVPVASPRALAELSEVADKVVCVEAPSWFAAVGQAYQRFDQVRDDEVVALLRRAEAITQSARAEDPDAPGVRARDEEVEIDAGGVRLPGHLTIPDNARGLVVFAHGSGSSRHSPRNRFVASVLERAGLGTLLFDLLTPAEELDRANVFDIELLAQRLVSATKWLASQPDAAGLPIGYFGASTGAGAALWAAAAPGVDVAAVVSRGGRPDLAGARLPSVTAPTLLIVGGADHVVLDLNHDAQRRLGGETRLTVIPGATHLFEEPGTLQAAAEAARDWFIEHCAGQAGDGPS